MCTYIVQCCVNTGILITESGGHDYFTSGLIPLKLQLRDLKMIYYGIDTTDLKVQIPKFVYDTQSDALVLDADENSIITYIPLLYNAYKRK